MRLLPQALRSLLDSRVHDERGVRYPSSLVMLSVIAIAVAAVTFVVTRSDAPLEREITTVAQSEPAPSATPTPTTPPSPKPKPINKGKVYVEVYNNTGIQGLAGRAADRAVGAGWQVVGSDNWVGTIPASTVYFPPRLKRAAQVLSLDLGIKRIQPAVDSMRLDRLTVVLTAELP